MWPLISVKVLRITGCVIEIIGEMSQRTERSLLVLSGRSNLIVEVVVWDVFSAARLYAKIAGRRDMINTRV